MRNVISVLEIMKEKYQHCRYKYSIYHMKILRCTVTCIVLSIQLFAQRATYCTYSEISKAQFDSCTQSRSGVKYLWSNPRIKKHDGKLAIPIVDRKPMIFVDDGEFETYKYIGDVVGTKLSLVKCEGPNDEKFYLISRLTKVVDTLIGQPVFLRNLTDFICANNPGTDEKQRIQFCELKNGSIKIRTNTSVAGYSLYEDIIYVTRNLIVAKDNYGKYWKLELKTEER